MRGEEDERSRKSITEREKTLRKNSYIVLTKNYIFTLLAAVK